MNWAFSFFTYALGMGVCCLVWHFMGDPKPEHLFAFGSGFYLMGRITGRIDEAYNP